MRAGCHIKLPRAIMMNRAVINVQSKDNACFAWSVVAALHPAKLKVDRESSYPHYTTVLNLQDIEFPVTVKQIKKFELINDISINVYSIKKENIVPIRLSELKRDKHVNLLYAKDNNVGHFAWIKNLSRLVSSQLSEKNHKKYICDRCLNYFDWNEKLQSHTIDCREINDCAIRLPNDKDKWLTFNNYNRKERLPFVVYADLECVLEKTKEERNFQHHKYLQSYDLLKPSSYLMYFDVNNLYGWAMCKPLLYADFRWVDDVFDFDTSSTVLDLPTGYILEVDLEYPQHIHDAHTDLLFCPTCDKPSGKGQDKLVATLYDKKRYVIHYPSQQPGNPA
ncbi:uncharacterized protein LOC115242545 [Formica exsecta]|uniref:uncharacterized protein LOC115242545 n=1 Tax=Formica exsecta TaxID=72781 RepID=UPI001144D412|nr:uncharacterized protein LOC115242545 [Formica exsecta]